MTINNNEMMEVLMKMKSAKVVGLDGSKMNNLKGMVEQVIKFMSKKSVQYEGKVERTVYKESGWKKLMRGY